MAHFATSRDDQIVLRRDSLRNDPTLKNDSRAFAVLGISEHKPYSARWHEHESNLRPVTITWHLQTPRYSFATQAQNPPPAAVDPGRPDEISCPNASGNNMVCIDKAENSGSWKYKIQITADSKGPCAGMNPPILDPNISND